MRTRDGRTFTHRVLHPKGTKQNPLSDADLEHKFRDMASLHMKDARIDRLLEQLWAIDRVQDMATLLPLLVFDSGKK